MHPNWSGQKLQAASLCEFRQRDAATHTERLQVGWYIIFMASEGGGREVVERRDDCKQDFGPWFKSRKLTEIRWQITGTAPVLRRAQSRKTVLLRQLCAFRFLRRNSYLLCQIKRSLNQNSQFSPIWIISSVPGLPPSGRPIITMYST